MPRSLKAFYFSIDLRSLGLYRVLTAALLICDWVLRWPDLEAFYTSFGVLPVEAPLPRSGGEFHFCLLDGVTSLVLVRVVFCFGLFFYACFLVGYRTRVFHALSFVFFLSVISRNLLIRDGSVVVLATMLLWSLFLPMGKRFSLDALLTKPEPLRDSLGQCCAPTLAALAIIAQIGLIYFFTASAKYGETWKDGTALYYALNQDQITRPLGLWVASQPLPLIKALTWATLSLEFAALPLILAPVAQPWLRRFAMVSLGGLHLGIALTTTFGFFSATMISTYALLLLPDDWALFSRLRSRWGSAGLITALARAQARLANCLQGGLAPGVGNHLYAPEPSWRTKTRSVAISLAVAVLFSTFAVDAFNLNLTKRLGYNRVAEPRWMRAIILASSLQHNWELFAPDPIKDDGWWVIAGETEGGAQLDPLTGKEPNFEKPAALAKQYDRFWRKYLERIWLKKNHEYRLYFGKYITRKNHREAPEGQRLARFNFYYVKERTPPPGTPQPWPTESILLWRHECFPKANQPKLQEEPGDPVESSDPE
jgi:hypothetical protein